MFDKQNTTPRYIVKVLIKISRLFTSIMFMFSCLYKYYPGSRSIMASRRDKGGGVQGFFVSFSEEKETNNHTASFFFAPSTSQFPSFPPSYSLFPLLLPSTEPDPFLPLL